MFVCWAVSQGAGVMSEEQIRVAALRLSTKSSDLEFEIHRYEEALNAALKRRERARADVQEAPSRAEAAALVDACLRIVMRLQPDEQLDAENEGYLRDLATRW